MSAITSHVLDTSRGRPAAGIVVHLAELVTGVFEARGSGVTDADGRVKGLLGVHSLVRSVYRLSFETNAYFAALGIESFYERIEVQFRVSDAAQHYHVPLLLNPFGYSTYRGS